MKQSWVAYAAILWGLSACASNVPLISSGERYAAPMAAVSYPLGIGDRLRIIVYNEEGLSGEFGIGPSGQLVLPVVGPIEATGQTVEQIASTIRTRLANGFLRDPQVAVDIVAYRPFFILGEVGQSGQYPYTVGMTIQSAVATAKGYTPRSDRRMVYIRGENDADEKAYAVTSNLKILPGDTIRVGERYF